VRLAELETKGQALKALAGQTVVIDRDSDQGSRRKAPAGNYHAALEIQLAKQNADRELSSLNDDLMNEFSVKVQSSKAFARKGNSGPSS